MNLNSSSHSHFSTRLATILLLLTLALTPFLVWPFYGNGVFSNAFRAENTISAVSIVSPSPGFLWIWPRVLLVLFAGLIGLLLLPSGKRLPRSTFSWVLVLYAMATLTSTIFANDNWGFKIIGGINRFDGLLYQCGMVLFGIFSYSLLRVANNISRFIYIILCTFAISSGVETLIILLQRLGIDFIGLALQGSSYGAPVGTIGNPGMVAGFLIIGVFSSMLLAEKVPDGKIKFFLYTLATFVSIGVGISANRSSILAIFIVLSLLLIVRRNGKALFALFIFILGALALATHIPNNYEYSRNIASTHTGKTRLLIWKLAAEAITKTPGQPFIGAGPDGFLITLETKIPIRELLQEYRVEFGWSKDIKIADVKPLFTEKDPLRGRAFMVTLVNDLTPGKIHRIIYRYNLDKAHNLLLDKAVSYGILAATLWLYLFILPIIKLYHRKDTTSLYLAGGVLALFIYYLAWFPIPETEPLHLTWLALAWVWAEALARNKENNELSSAR